MRRPAFHESPCSAGSLSLLPAPAPCATCAAQAAPYPGQRRARSLERLPRRADPVQRELLRLRARAERQTGRPGAGRRAGAALYRTGRASKATRATSAMPRPRWRRGGASRSRRRPGAACCAPRCARAPTISRPRWPTSTAVLKRDSGNAQAWLTRATVQLVHGRLRRRAHQLHAPVFARAGAGGASLPGRASAASAARPAPVTGACSRRSARRPTVRPDCGVWVQTLLAEMAARRGGYDARRSRTTATRWRWVSPTATCWAPMPISCSTMAAPAEVVAPAEGQDPGRRAAAALRASR